MRRLLIVPCSFATAILVLGVSACDDPQPPAPPVPAASAQPPPPPPPPPVSAQAEDKKQLTDDDFVESIDLHRDPFRSYLGEFATPLRRTVKVQRRVLLQRYGLDELQLIAVVSGAVRARAMFRDPTGLGVSVKRGDYISKNAGRVKQILPDKVIVQISEHTEDQQRMADRVVELHSKSERETRDKL